MDKVAIKQQLKGRKASVGNLTGLWLGDKDKEREVWVFNLSIWVKKRERD